MSPSNLKTYAACLFLVLLFCTSQGHAATLVKNGAGEVTGASGVNVGGTPYEFEFVDSSCAALYNGCNSADDFLPFTTADMADMIAALSEIATLVINDPTVNPIHVLGCEQQSCSLLTPVGRTGSNVDEALVSFASTFIIRAEATTQSIGGQNLLDLTNFPDVVFAVPSPTVLDTDEDGISDADDNCPAITNTDQSDFDEDDDGDACDADDDDDVLTDSEELAIGTDPKDRDSDDDLLFDGDEISAGADPLNADSDGDGLSDGQEVSAGTNPIDADSDDDGLSDGEESAAGTNPHDADSDDDGLLDGEDPNPIGADADGDGLNDAQELAIGSDPNDADSDNDGLQDGNEVAIGTHPLDADSDNDGLQDGNEVALGANPNDADSDDDGLLDGADPYPTVPEVPDSDGDGVPDDSDNCPTVPNANQADTNNDGFGDACDELTPEGSDVAVNPVVTLPGGAGTTTVELTFDNVETSGATNITAASAPSGGAPGSPPGFKIGTPPVYYDVSTTAVFNGSVTLCFSWQEGQFNNETNIKLFHFENGSWLNVTTSLNTVANKVCGEVSSLSPFALFESSFAGFFAPVDNLPIRNAVKAGAAVPVKFSLGSNQGLSIFQSGYPVSQSVACDSGNPSDAIEETVTAGASSLSYDSNSDRYTYVWKTDKAWAKTCRRLILKLNSGLQNTAEFVFSK